MPHRLIGEDIAWADEVERCLGVRPEPVDEDVFRASHARLDAVLPGTGDLSSRYNAWLDSAMVPPAMVPRAIDALQPELRRRTAQLIELPPGEGADFETVTGEVWQAFNSYRGELRSLVQVNEDLPITFTGLVDTVAHEAYPGHHTERVCKEQLLYRDEGRLETAVMIAAAPEALITEGIATNALEEALGAEGFEPIAAIGADLGFRLEAEVAEVAHVEGWRLFAADANAAQMVHEGRIVPDEAEAYV